MSIDKHKDLKDRTKAFALRVIKMSDALLRTRAANVITNQILRSATPWPQIIELWGEHDHKQNLCRSSESLSKKPTKPSSGLKCSLIAVSFRNKMGNIAR